MMNIKMPKRPVCSNLRGIEQGVSFVFTEAVIPTPHMKVGGPAFPVQKHILSRDFFAVNLTTGEVNKFNGDTLITEIDVEATAKYKGGREEITYDVP